ncbi:MAG: Calx-beta domain-containing protein [Pyrinomonadaceae bacterium]
MLSLRKGTRQFLGVALLLGTLGGGVAGQRQISPSSHTLTAGGRILFSSERDGNYEIYVANPDGSGPTRLTNSELSDREPAWSPDGNRLAFASDRDGDTEIYVMSLNGDGNGFVAPTKLTNNTADDGSPAWSPDGNRIAFVSGRGGNDEIFVMNADGSGQTNVSNNPHDDNEPAWSPDSAKIAFTSARDGNEEIYTMDATGTAQTNISNNFNGDDRSPSWVGNRIAFVSTRDGNEEIYAMNADNGSGQTRLTNNPATDTEPTLSGDGARIAFASSRDNNGISFEIYVMNANGTGQTRLTANGEDNDFEVALQRQAAPAAVVGSSTIQFGSAAFTISEGAGSATITITRIGDTSGAAIVNVAVTSGTASERADFTTVLDVVNFAAGETSRTFTVLISDDAYAEFDETANLTLSGLTNASLGTQNTATLVIADNDLAPSGINPADGIEFFVRQHYLDFLNREPEQAGFDSWVNTLRNCPAGDTSCDRIAVSSAFFRSDEYQLKGYFVIRFHLAAFGRLPNFHEFISDSQRINAATGAEVVVNQAAYANEFVLRAEFRGIYDALNNTQYVDRVLQTAGVTVPNRTQLIADLNSNTITRAQALRNIVESSQFFQAAFNRGFVASQYYGYLRREPEPAGFQAWLTFLNANPGDFRTMVNGFVNSIEYRLRFGQP